MAYTSLTNRPWWLPYLLIAGIILFFFVVVWIGGKYIDHVQLNNYSDANREANCVIIAGIVQCDHKPRKE